MEDNDVDLDLKDRVVCLLKTFKADKDKHAAYADAVAFIMSRGKFESQADFIKDVRGALANLVLTEIEDDGDALVMSLCREYLSQALDRLESYRRTLRLLEPIIAATPDWIGSIETWYSDQSRVHSVASLRARFLLPVMLMNPLIAGELTSSSSRKRAAEDEPEGQVVKRARVDPPST